MYLILFNAFLGSQKVRENIMARLSSLSPTHTQTHPSYHVHIYIIWSLEQWSLRRMETQSFLEGNN